MALLLLGVLGRDERAFYASSSLFVSADYGKTPTIQPPKALLQQPCIGASRCTGREISARRDASSGRSK